MALVETAGLRVANAADESASGSSTATTRPGPGPRGGHEVTSAELQSIASKLGVTTTQLQAAIAANRPARPTGSRSDHGDAMAAELPTALGADAASRRSGRRSPPAGARGGQADGRRPAPRPPSASSSARG